MPSALPVIGPRFVDLPAHRLWLLNQADRLFAFFQRAAIHPGGGFQALDNEGKPLPPAAGRNGVERQIHDTTRMVHCFAIAHLMGVPGADDVIDHGMAYLWSHHRDTVHGGYVWGVDDKGPTNATKQAYGHAFVLLAASSAKVVGHPDADRLLADVATILTEHFWDSAAGAAREEFERDWSPMGDYRGQNSNMHLTEATMAAFEATGERRFLEMAESIASLIIGHHARAAGWRVPEHYDSSWRAKRDYDGNPMFRPFGTTPGHALEWSRLLVQLWELGGRRHEWLPDAASQLFRQTVADGWDPVTGGFYYTLDWEGKPHRPDRYWWPCAEGIGAAAALAAINADSFYESWYRRIWSFAANHLIDHRHGGWLPELDNDLKPVNRVFVGKPDLYHAVQACLIPLLPVDGSLTKGLRGPAGRSLIR